MYDLIIIGGGPAGLTAALYAGRARLKTLILEKMALGGQIILTSVIENFPGFPGSIATDKLVSAMEKQVKDLGVQVKNDEATRIISDAGFKIYGQEAGYQAKAVIVASGATYKKLDIPGEEKFRARGVSYCATCDAPFFKGKKVAVVGGGDKAVEEALYLARHAKEVVLVHRRSELRASKILQEKLFQDKKIATVLNAVPLEIIGGKTVTALKIKDVNTAEIKEIKTDGVFVFIGIRANAAFLGDFLKLAEDGFILTDEEMRTSQEGVFAAGDCRKRPLNQVITACADGAVAAFGANRYLEAKQ